MGLKELDSVIRTNLDKCATADREGRPVEVRERLIRIKEWIVEYLGEVNAVKEEPEVKEEQPTKPGHCQPDAVHEDTPEPKETKQETREGTPYNQEQAGS